MLYVGVTAEDPWEKYDPMGVLVLGEEGEEKSEQLKGDTDEAYEETDEEGGNVNDEL